MNLTALAETRARCAAQLEALTQLEPSGGKYVDDKAQNKGYRPLA